MNDCKHIVVDLTKKLEIQKTLREALIKQKVQKFKNKISGFFGRE